jgi:hypothetical protein
MFKTHISTIKTIRQGDDDFMLNDGMIMSPRAGFEIAQECPTNYRKVIAECINYGWLKPVAHLHDHEYMWDKLREQS